MYSWYGRCCGMRRPETAVMDCEFPGRYTLDEARFTGGSVRISHSSLKEAKL